MKKPDSVVMVPGNKDSFFKKWVEFLKPLHNLPPREMEVASAFIKHRYELSKVIKDPELLDKVTMGEDTRKKVRAECDLSVSNFQAILWSLRKRGFIIDGRINPRFIPNIVEDSDSFKLLIYFNLK